MRTSREFLDKFVRDFQVLYGLRFCLINVHQLLHYPHIVQQLGPLWSYTCYEYENLNGLFLNLINGKNYIDSQIINSQSLLISMTRFIENLPDGAVKNFCEQKKKQVKINERILDNCFSVGCYKHIPILNVLHEQALRNFRRLRNFRMCQYCRILQSRKLYVAEAYKTRPTCKQTHKQYNMSKIMRKKLVLYRAS